MALKWKVTVEGETVTLNAFFKIQEGVIDLNNLGAWDMVVSIFRKVQAENFDSEGASGRTGKWEALSVPYARAKLKEFGDKPILQATGAMKADFTSSGDVVKEPQELIFTFKSPAGYHMSKESRSRMPYRSSLELSDDQKKRIVDPLVVKVKQLVQNAKLAERRGF